MSLAKPIFSYGIDHLTVGYALSIANGDMTGIINDKCRSRVEDSRKVVDQILTEGKAVYGINTGFGPLCNTRISTEETTKLQYNILKSHSVGVGVSIPTRISKLMLILKLQALSQGYSGVSSQILDRINWHIQEDVIPVVPSQGSVGASGDLAPLAHLFLPLIGLGKVQHKGTTKDTKEVLKKFNFQSVQLGAKEGLGLINGTQFITAYAVQVVDNLANCLDHADIIGALMVEGLQGSCAPFNKELHNLRPYKGTKHVAHRVTQMLHSSEIVESHKDCDRVQDPYSLRCIPQVHGASRNAWLHLKELTEIELNSVTDNPVIINKNLCISGGNFHGQPLAMPLDYACLAASEIGSISDRRTYLSLHGIVDVVPKLLMKETGTNSAFMMLQYTSAALASENKTLCFPASADSIPTSLGQEDHVSMGSISGRKALQVIENVEKILAIELICAAQAFDFHKPLRSSKTLDTIHKIVRTKISFATEDRIFSTDIEEAINLIKNRTLTDELKSKNLAPITTFSSIFDAY